MKEQDEIFNDAQVLKYEQVVRLILSDIQAGIYKLGERIPSINDLSVEYLVSRDTVEKAYKKLRDKGVIKSIPGKGYFICNTEFSNFLKICLLFNKLSSYKKETYDGFIKILENKATVDLHIYNYNLKIFDQIITSHLKDYDYFVIVPHFLPGTLGASEIVKKIPKEKVIIVDKMINDIFNEYPIVYQDFERDIFDALTEGKDLLKQYKKLNLIYPQARYFSKEIPLGFVQFCKTYDFDYSIIDRIEDEELKYKEAYVIISDKDLVYVIKEARKSGFLLGKAVGVVSYNESPEKEVLEGGITTISTNHGRIGEEAAKMILSKEKGTVKIPFTFNQRNSL